MRKFSRIDWDPTISPRRRSAGRVLLLVLILAASPLVIDGAMLCLARWTALFGPVPVVETPALDYVESHLGNLSDTLVRVLKQPFKRVPWDPDLVIGFLFFCAAGGMFMLTSRDRR